MAVKPARREVGKLIVVCLKAQHLPSKHTFTKQDPYCVVKLSNSGEEKTAVDKGGGQHPVWDEQFTYTVFQVEGEVEKLEVIVWSKELGDDEEIGKGEVIIDLKWPNNEFDDWVPLMKDGKEKGEVFLEMTFYPVLQVQAAAGKLTRRPSKLTPDQRLAKPTKGPLPKPGQGQGQGHPLRIASGSQLPSFPEENRLPARRNSLDDLTGTSSPVENVAFSTHAQVNKNAYKHTSPVQPDRLPLPGDPDLPAKPEWMNPGRRVGGNGPDDQPNNQGQGRPIGRGRGQGPSRGQGPPRPESQSTGNAEPGIGGFVAPSGTASMQTGAWEETQNAQQGHSGPSYHQSQHHPQPQPTPQPQQQYPQQRQQQPPYQQNQHQHQQSQQQPFFPNQQQQQQQQAGPHRPPYQQQHSGGAPFAPTSAPAQPQGYPQSSAAGSQINPQTQAQHYPATTAPYGGSPYSTATSYPAYSGPSPGPQFSMPASQAPINSFAPTRFPSYTPGPAPAPKPTPQPLSAAPPKRNAPTQPKYYSAAPATQTVNPNANHAPPPIPALPKPKPVVEAAPAQPPPIPQRPSNSSVTTVDMPGAYRESEPAPPGYAPPVPGRNPTPPSPTVSSVSTALPAFEDVVGQRARSPTPPPVTPPSTKSTHVKPPVRTAPAAKSPSPTPTPGGSSRPASVHPGQAELHERIQQERRDAAMAARMAAEAEQDEERTRQERERMDEEFAKLMTEQDGGEEEARRLREEEDERLARALAERAE